MSNNEFYSALSADQKVELANRCGGYSVEYIKKVFNGNKKPGKKLCLAIEDVTGGAIKAKTFRPDLFS